ncbi:MAG: ABC transporter ATP-binding protein, partial [Chlamydiota bacterium]
PKKLSYKEQNELEGMESAISSAEEKLLCLQKKLEEGQDPKETLITYKQLGEAQVSLDSLYERWQILLDKASSL